MASFVVETFVAQSDRDRFEDDVRNLQAAAATTHAAARRVRHLRSYLVPADAMGFHVMEAEIADDRARTVGLAQPFRDQHQREPAAPFFGWNCIFTGPWPSPLPCTWPDLVL